MEKSDNTLPASMLDDLKKCKGLVLDSVLCTDNGSPTLSESIQVVVLRFQDFDVELWNEEQRDIPGGVTDIAKIRIFVNPDQDVKSPVGKTNKSGKFVPSPFVPTKINKTVEGITIHNDIVRGFDAQGEECFDLKNTHVIVISLGDIFLHIVKDYLGSEFWDVFIKKTGVPEPSSEWENDEEWSYEVQSCSIDL